MFMECGTDGAFPVGIRAWRHFGWNSEKLLSIIITCQLARKWLRICVTNVVLQKLSSYCAFTLVVIRIGTRFSERIIHLVIHFS